MGRLMGVELLWRRAECEQAALCRTASWLSGVSLAERGEFGWEGCAGCLFSWGVLC
jgi:hypothetical protein